MHTVWGVPNFSSNEVPEYKNFSFMSVTGGSSYLDDVISSSNFHTISKVVHFIASLGGYFKAFAPYVGVTRMITGSLLLYTCVATALTDVSRQAQDEKKQFLFKYIPVALGLITRGALEAFVPYGGIINGALDIANTAFDHWLLKEPARIPEAAPSPSIPANSVASNPAPLSASSAALSTSASSSAQSSSASVAVASQANSSCASSASV